MEHTVGLSPSLERDLLSLASELGEADSTGLVSRLHAFIEMYLRERFPEIGPRDTFPELLRAVSPLLGPPGGGKGKIDREEALAARHNFLRFCALCGIESRALEDFARPLREWNERRLPPGEGSERERLQSEILDSQAGNGKLLSRSAEWAKDKQRLAELDGEALRLRAERERLQARGEPGKKRAAALAGELEECDRQRGLLAQRLETYRELDTYVQNVSRFSL